MYFTSYEFIVFLLICFGLYYVIPKRFQWVLLLVASFVFYYINGPFYPLFLLATSILTYTSAIFIENKKNADAVWYNEHKAELSKEEKKSFKQKANRSKRFIMLCGLLSCILILGVFKYTNFVIGNINGVMSMLGSGKQLRTLDLLLPMGLSFYTFQSLGYLLDVHMGKIKAQRHYFKYLLFVSFFPQLIQGPISRYSEIAEDLYAEHSFEWKRIRFGLERILWGFFKKLVVADTLSSAVANIMGDTSYYKGAWVLVGILFYATQLYADFSGGIDITIGIAEVFGIILPENFIRPYFSKNIAEFWRRWHITMGTWFRDYIFYPMSVAPSMISLTQKCKARFGKNVARRVPVYLATMVTWFATGIWHGASWNFIVWGLLNFAVLMISEEFEPLYDKFHNRFAVEGKAWYKIFQIGRTFLLVCILNLFDCYVSVADTFKAFGTMLTAKNWSVLFTGGFLELGLTGIDYAVVGLGVLIMLMVSLVQRSGSVREKIWKKAYPVQFCIWFGLFLCILLLGAYGVGYDASQFIYNRF